MAGADDWIDTVIARAGELRAAGVLSIGFEGCTATFSPPDPVIPTGDIESDVSVDGLDPLNDPASYVGGIVPGFSITKLALEE